MRKPLFKWQWLFSGMLTALLWGALAQAVMSESEMREAIRSVLAIRHPDDSGDWWRSLGPTAPAVILAMYREEDSIYRKIRLVDALAWYDDVEATRFLKEQAEGNPNQSLRNAAIRALVKSKGTQEGGFISQVLASGNPHSRVAAAKALSELQDTRAASLVDQYLKDEKNSWAQNTVKAHRASLRSLSLQGRKTSLVKKQHQHHH